MSLTNLPWYAYIILGVFAVFFIIQKVLPFFKRAKQVFSSYLKNPKGSNLKPDQLSALSVGAINGEQTSCFIDTLETGMQEERLHESLSQWWSINSSDSAKETLDWLLNEGHRVFFNAVYKIVTTEDQSEWQTIINNAFPPEAIDNATEFTENLSSTIEELRSKDNMTEQDFNNGILAWDLGRMITVARMSCDAKLISQTEAWEYINQSYEMCKKEFNSWEAIGKSYIIGRSMWSGDDSTLNGLKSITRSLLEDEKSPWITNKYHIQEPVAH